VPELTLQGLHLVLEAEFQLLEPNLFDLLILGKKSLLGEGFEPLGVLGMFRNKAPEFFIPGNEDIPNLSCHPVDLLQTVLARKRLAWGRDGFNRIPAATLIFFLPHRWCSLRRRFEECRS
jgi:hypothetical protein